MRIAILKPGNQSLLYIARENGVLVEYVTEGIIGRKALFFIKKVKVNKYLY